MGHLDEPGLKRLVAAGCPSCGSHRLTFATYVDGSLPIMAGEPIGRITWVYDGEKFVDGVFEVGCASCRHIVFSSDACPRCHATGALARALESTNDWPVPVACPSCEGEELRYIALVPAIVEHEGKRADKARTSTELYDPGFHGYRIDCRDCRTVSERKECPICKAPPPLRVRPG